MARHTAIVRWQRNDAEFVDEQYSRAHEWQFDGGAVIPASASPHVVPEPHSVAANVDPEEAFVAALSSCHMLFFLSLAAAQGIVVDQYVDEAVGTMGKTPQGRLAITGVRLRPAATYHGAPPSAATLDELHAAAHRRCFIANSVTAPVTIERIS